MARASRRAVEAYPVEKAQHAGLAYLRLLPRNEASDQDRDNDAHPLHQHTKAVALVPTTAHYASAFRSWQTAMTALSAYKFTGETVGPLAIGLGNASPTEVGLTLHHTYGVPFLPGTALKGLASRAAVALGIERESEAFGVLFGDTVKAAHLVWWDAWIDPGSQHPLQPDVVTVHHPEYYAQQGKVYPTDFDDPNPVPFLSVRSGVTFHLALSGTADLDREWLHTAAAVLEYGLTHLGIGGKTNAGYGTLDVIRDKSPRELAQERQQDEDRLLAQAAAEVRKQEAEARAQAEREEAQRAQENAAQMARAASLERATFERLLRRAAEVRINTVDRETKNLLNEMKTLSTDAQREVLGTLLEATMRFKERQLAQRVRAALEALA